MSNISILYDRAAMLAKARDFFARRTICEVDCPLLSASASIDCHIDLIPASPQGGSRFLHSSPEYGMKRLLAAGMKDIYQLAHVFRDGECGFKHNPEFMMAEWYRLGLPFLDMISDTVEFIKLFLGELPYKIITYREAFQHYAQLDYTQATKEDLLLYIKQNNIPCYPSIEKEDTDALLNLILGVIIEPQLGKKELCVLAYYPASQAALAQTCWRNEEKVSERFEVYFQGVELANGYHELANAVEQRERLIEANRSRQAMNKAVLPLDENFLKALEQGLPDCCGVAVGFDRLMMLRHKQAHIANVMPFGWEKA